MLNVLQVFDLIHVSESARQSGLTHIGADGVDGDIDGSGGGGGGGTIEAPILHCFNVWFAEQLPWQAEDAFRSSCMFSVVQSTSGVPASSVLRQYLLAWRGA